MSDPIVITTSGPAPDSLVTEQEYLEREASRPPVNSFGAVSNEAEFDSALAAGGVINLGGNTINCTGVKTVTKAWTTIIGPGHLRFVGIPKDTRCFLIQASDVTLRDFELSSDEPPPFSLIGINFPSVAHRAKIQRLHIHNWGACITKYGGVTSPYINDILIEDCYVHTFLFGGYMSFGLRRMLVQRCQFIGKLSGETHSTWNAFYGAANLEDCRFENNEFGDVDKMGIEITTVEGAEVVRPVLIQNRVFNCDTFGISLGHPQGAYVARNIVRNVKGIGIEMGGAIQTIGWATVIDNDVEGVTNHPTGNGEAVAYILNRMRDSVMRGNRSAKISSSANPVWAYGTYIYESERCSVIDGEFVDGGGLAIYVNPGSTGNTGGFHLLAGNSFRHTVNVVGGAAIHVGNTTVVAKNNTSWQKPGWSLGFRASCSAPARVECDAIPVTSGSFYGSNKVISA